MTEVLGPLYVLNNIYGNKILEKQIFHLRIFLYSKNFKHEQSKVSIGNNIMSFTFIVNKDHFEITNYYSKSFNKTPIFFINDVSYFADHDLLKDKKINECETRLKNLLDKFLTGDWIKWKW